MQVGALGKIGQETVKCVSGPCWTAAWRRARRGLRSPGRRLLRAGLRLNGANGEAAAEQTGEKDGRIGA